MIYVKICRKINFLLVVSFMLLCSSCSNDYCDTITKQIKEKQEFSKEEIMLDLNEIFEFDWDTLYVCGPYGFDQEVSSFIGFNTQYDYVKEGETLFAFIKKDKVIEEKLISCNKIGFFKEKAEESECLVIKSSDAKFKVKNLSQKSQNYWLNKQ